MDFLYYDETSPSGLRWKVDIYSGQDYRTIRVKAGDIAGSISHRGYWQVILAKKSHKVHRVIWELLVAAIPLKHQIDHVNGVKTDNRLSNLRCVTNAVNKRNSPKYKNNTSGITGVRRTKMGDTSYWSANWCDLSGKLKARYFSFDVYGEDIAFKMACECREQAIEDLNRNNGGYSATHGQ